METSGGYTRINPKSLGLQQANERVFDVKKYMVALMTGALALSLMAGCSSQGDPKGDSPSNPTGGIQTEKPSAPTSGTPSTDMKQPSDSTQAPSGTESKATDLQSPSTDSKSPDSKSGSGSADMKSTGDGASSNSPQDNGTQKK
jgi:hypothetical protein